jgi:hypothetical protein
MSLYPKREIKFKSHGLFSGIARKTGYTVTQINQVYTWYINEVLEQLGSTPACQVYLKGLGLLKFDAGLSIRNLAGFINGLQVSVSEFIDDSQPPRVTYSYLVNRHKLLVDAIYSFRERLAKLKSLGNINETYYINKLTRSEKLENQLNQIYESIQRIPEYQQKRTTERGQDFVWTDEQGSKPF